MGNYLDEIAEQVKEPKRSRKEAPPQEVQETPTPGTEKVQEVPVPVPEPVPVEGNPAQVFEVSIAAGSTYNVDDLALILEIFMFDKPLQVGDLVAAAQARYYMSTRKDGCIPEVLRKQLVLIHKKYSR